MQRVFAYRSFLDAAAPAGRQGLHGRPSVAGHPIAPANLPSIGRGCLIFRKATRIKQRRGRRIMVIPKLPKLEPWVRFPSPAPLLLTEASLRLRRVVREDGQPRARGKTGLLHAGVRVGLTRTGLSRD